MTTFPSSAAFEEEVIRIARAIYGEQHEIGRESLQGRERDCVIRTRDEIVVVEATLDPRKEKTEFDAKKTHDLVNKLRRENSLPVNGILVVFREPTDAQREVEKRFRSTLRLQSYKTFLARLMDGERYLRGRSNFRFGSIVDPRDENDTVGRSVRYVEVPLVAAHGERSESQPTDLANSMLKGDARLIVSGEFGSGKSMTLRHIFSVIRNAYQSSETRRIPVYLNLRDHAGHRFRSLVEPIIDICTQEGLCHEFKRRGIDLVAPINKNRRRALQILNQVHSSNDRALVRARQL